eukprot:scaffold174212_cov15-Tisochrysis_lutea.AAC.3
MQAARPIPQSSHFELVSRGAGQSNKHSRAAFKTAARHAHGLCFVCEDGSRHGTFWIHQGMRTLLLRQLEAACVLWTTRV